MQAGREFMMRNFWLKPRQVVVLDAQSGRPARNFHVRPLSVLLTGLILLLIPFMIGSTYAPFHRVQDIIPQNLMLKRQNDELIRKIADTNTLSDLKKEQLESLEEDLLHQEDIIRDMSKQLHMFKSILESRKGTGVHLLQSQAGWTKDKYIDWQSVLVKGGSIPRFLVGKYRLFAIDNEGNRLDLNGKKMSYRFETHVFLHRKFEWHETWTPTNLELTVYNSRRKQVLQKNIPIIGE